MVEFKRTWGEKTLRSLRRTRSGDGGSIGDGDDDSSGGAVYVFAVIVVVVVVVLEGCLYSYT